MPRTGHCHCGAVHFTVEGEPLRMSQCHCNACRRISGTGHLSQAFFKRSQITIAGETKTHESTADSGSTRIRHFCPTCGSRLFSESSRAPENMGIAIGAFDDTSWFQPTMIVYHSERPAWDFVDPSLPTKERM